ncbi:MAG TPA: hypothetical protein P5201_02730 [Aminobacteriaceae bacterium]|nr:hypothetical protein [Synergistales bacterium]HRV97478.1 hypothetical protein [Aminobacteriaceae bacterium]
MLLFLFSPEAGGAGKTGGLFAAQRSQSGEKALLRRAEDVETFPREDVRKGEPDGGERCTSSPSGLCTATNRSSA